MRRRPPTSLRLLVQTAKCTVVGVLSFLAVAGTAPGGLAASDAPVDDAALRAQARLGALMVEHDCSSTGFGPSVVPGSALVERDERVLHVSFDDGWATYTGDAPGTLLAVCRPPL
ncbi:hypothetical protein [Nocardioides sp. R-C-SC26]|uniref:hypothetical protein n=1 Tax=Nocardioides sp. R-C-SC26 TaxID=2870414 RepID=UPI001E2C2A4B|nr:hypothetical protein [Nocardioides sp. R-C-SC26]